MFDERKEEVGVGVTEARVIYTILSQKQTLVLSGTSNKHKFTALWRFSVTQQQFRSPESSVCLSLPLSVSLWLFMVSPRQSLKREAGECHALDPLTHRSSPADRCYCSNLSLPLQTPLTTPPYHICLLLLCWTFKRDSVR